MSSDELSEDDGNSNIQKTEDRSGRQEGSAAAALQQADGAFKNMNLAAVPPASAPQAMDIDTGVHIGTYRVTSKIGGEDWNSHAQPMAIISADDSGGLGLFDECDGLCEDSCEGVTINDVAPDGMFVSAGFGEKSIPCLSQQVVIALAAQVICGSALEDFCTQVLVAPAHEAEEIRARQTAARIPDITPEFLIRQTRLRAEKCAKVKKTLKSTAHRPLMALIGSTQGHDKYSMLELREGCIGICWEGSNLLGRAWEVTRAGNDKDLLQDPHIILCRSRDKPSFERTFSRIIEVENLLGAVAFACQYNFGGSCISMTVVLPPAASDTTTLLQNLAAIMAEYSHIALGLLPPVPILTPEHETVAAWLRKNAGPPYEIMSNGGGLLQLGRYGTGTDKRYVRGSGWTPEGLHLLRVHFMQLMNCLFLKDKPRGSEGQSGLPIRQLSGLTLQAPAASEDPNRPSSSRQSLTARPSSAVSHPSRALNALHHTRGGIARNNHGRHLNNATLQLSLADVASLLDGARHASTKHPRRN